MSRLLTIKDLRIEGYQEEQWNEIVCGVSLELNRGEVLGTKYLDCIKRWCYEISLIGENINYTKVPIKKAFVFPDQVTSLEG